MTDEYRAYLLRLWRTQNDGQSWRVLLENVETSERLGFASLEKLIEFLQSLNQPGQGLEKEDSGGIESSAGSES